MSRKAEYAIIGVDAVSVEIGNVQIAETVQKLGANIVMAGEICWNGTVRCVDAVNAPSMTRSHLSVGSARSVLEQLRFFCTVKD